MLSKIDILGSSSSGNAYVLTFDDKVVYQLDAGVKNKNAEKVNKLFITHDKHIDHGKYIKDFDESKVILPSEKERNNKEWSSFIVPHAVLNNGYVIEHDNEKIVYITDCGDQWGIKKKFKDATMLIIECNWDFWLVKQGLIKVEDYSSYAFSKKGHMSNLDCLNLIAYMEIPKDCKIMFVHKSGHHATYDNTYKLFDSLPNKKYIAKKGETLYVKSWKNI